jgi:hypothetical protein
MKTHSQTLILVALSNPPLARSGRRAKLLQAIAPTHCKTIQTASAGPLLS